MDEGCHIYRIKERREALPFKLQEELDVEPAFPRQILPAIQINFVFHLVIDLVLDMIHAVRESLARYTFVQLICILDIIVIVKDVIRILRYRSTINADTGFQ